MIAYFGVAGEIIFRSLIYYIACGDNIDDCYYFDPGFPSIYITWLLKRFGVYYILYIYFIGSAYILLINYIRYGVYFPTFILSCATLIRNSIALVVCARYFTIRFFYGAARSLTICFNKSSLYSSRDWVNFYCELLIEATPMLNLNISSSSV